MFIRNIIKTLLVSIFVVLIVGCTGLGNYLNGANWDGSPTYINAKLKITNFLDEDIMQVWVREDEDYTWRFVLGAAAIMGYPIIEKGKSATIDVVTGKTEVKLLMKSGREVIRSVYVSKQGSRLQFGQPAPRPKPVVTRPTQTPPKPVKNTTPKPTIKSVTAKPVNANMSDLIGSWQSQKRTNPVYGDVSWKSLTIGKNGQAIWRWHQDFSSSSLRRSRDSCHTESREFNVSYRKKGDGTLRLQCRSHKQLWCTGKVKKRGCFAQEIQVELTDQGLLVKNGDGDGPYVKQ